MFVGRSDILDTIENHPCHQKGLFPLVVFLATILSIVHSEKMNFVNDYDHEYNHNYRLKENDLCDRDDHE